MFTRTMTGAVLCAFLAVAYGSPAVAAAPDPAAQRQSEEQAAQDKIEKLDRDMKELEAESKRTGEQPRVDINRLYEQFKKDSEAARQRLQELRKSTNEAWGKARESMNKAIDNLNGLYERTKAKVKGEGNEGK